MFIKAIHTIQRDPRANPPVVRPGKVADLHGDELDYVLRADVRAAVEATEAEIIAAGFRPPVDFAAEVAAREAAEQEAAEAAAKETAEKEAAEAAAKEAAEKEAAEAAAKVAKKGGKKAADDESLV